MGRFARDGLLDLLRALAARSKLIADLPVGPQGWAIMVIARPERMVAARRAIAVRHVVRHPRVFQPIKRAKIIPVPQLSFSVAFQQFPVAFSCEWLANPGWYSPC